MSFGFVKRFDVLGLALGAEESDEKSCAQAGGDGAAAGPPHDPRNGHPRSFVHKIRGFIVHKKFNHFN